jgi:hypothetical protein
MPVRKLVLGVATLVAALTCAQDAPPAQQPSIEVPYRGLTYSMMSRGGVTVMVAPLNRMILEYQTVQVWISNGSKSYVRIAPQQFEVRQQGTVMLAGTSDDTVIDEIQQRARPKDLLELVEAYETTLYGFANERSLGYYQQRKQAARTAMGAASKMRATATASAIILPSRLLKPGEIMDGTVFFRIDPHAGRIVTIGAHIAGGVYDFPQTPPEEHIH